VDGKELVADPSRPLAALVFKTRPTPASAASLLPRHLRRLEVGLAGMECEPQPPSGLAPSTTSSVRRRSRRRRSRQATSALSRSWRRHTGTLCARGNAVTLEPISFPQPSFSAAISLKTKADLDKMGTALNRIVEEDRACDWNAAPIPVK
jgi:elongation factor G